MLPSISKHITFLVHRLNLLDKDLWHLRNNIPIHIIHMDRLKMFDPRAAVSGKSIRSASSWPGAGTVHLNGEASDRVDLGDSITTQGLEFFLAVPNECFLLPSSHPWVIASWGIWSSPSLPACCSWAGPPILTPAFLSLTHPDTLSYGLSRGLACNAITFAPLHVPG